MPKLRRHHNNKGYRQIQNDKLYLQVESMERRILDGKADPQSNRSNPISGESISSQQEGKETTTEGAKETE